MIWWTFVRAWTWISWNLLVVGVKNLQEMAKCCSHLQFQRRWIIFPSFSWLKDSTRLFELGEVDNNTYTLSQETELHGRVRWFRKRCLEGRHPSLMIGWGFWRADPTGHSQESASGTLWPHKKQPGVCQWDMVSLIGHSQESVSELLWPHRTQSGWVF